jgi:hypothetical protein
MRIAINCTGRTTASGLQSICITIPTMSNTTCIAYKSYKGPKTSYAPTKAYNDLILTVLSAEEIRYPSKMHSMVSSLQSSATAKPPVHIESVSGSKTMGVVGNGQVDATKDISGLENKLEEESAGSKRNKAPGVGVYVMFLCTYLLGILLLSLGGLQ